MAGRKKYAPTPEQRKQVDAMAAYGVPEHAIAKVIGCDPKTLRRYFRDELDTAHIRANSAVAQSLFQKATGDGPQCVTAAIFWAKTRMGWKEPPQAIQHSGAIGAYDLTKLSDDDLKRLAAILGPAAPLGADSGGDQAA
jgi:hypothetical protein